ncbi:hypothetical protein D1872_263540 [compost metagenome]
MVAELWVQPSSASLQTGSLEEGLAPDFARDNSPPISDPFLAYTPLPYAPAIPQAVPYTAQGCSLFLLSYLRIFVRDPVMPKLHHDRSAPRTA